MSHRSVGTSFVDPDDLETPEPSELEIETCRSGGPGTTYLAAHPDNPHAVATITVLHGEPWAQASDRDRLGTEFVDAAVEAVETHMGAQR